MLLGHGFADILEFGLRIRRSHHFEYIQRFINARF